jgi:hypothetical protein
MTTKQDTPRLDRFTVVYSYADEEWTAKAYDQFNKRLPDADYFGEHDDCQSTAQFELGRSDRLNGLPCRSTNGKYLDGFYSV